MWGKNTTFFEFHMGTAIAANPAPPSGWSNLGLLKLHMVPKFNHIEKNLYLTVNKTLHTHTKCLLQSNLRNKLRLDYLEYNQTKR